MIITPGDLISSTVLFFSHFVPPNSALYGIMLWLKWYTYSSTHQTQCRLNLSVSEGEAHLIALTAAQQEKRKAETGLVLMTDNPVTNSWSSSKGLLSRLWLCDVNGT